ncbi:MAG: hypothetical protein R3A51_19695 [Nannocystaceae bacterium]|nr:hypothetical protein [Myxococcales bacterium]
MVAPPSVKVPAAPRVAAPKIPVVTAPQLGAPKVPGVGAPIVTAPVIGAAPSAAPAFPQFELDDWDAALDGLEMEERVEVGGP